MEEHSILYHLLKGIIKHGTPFSKPSNQSHIYPKDMNGWLLHNIIDSTKYSASFKYDQPYMVSYHITDSAFVHLGFAVSLYNVP